MRTVCDPRFPHREQTEIRDLVVGRSPGRGALAAGELLFRGGDYYGPIVNLAARLADLAVPHEVLVTPEVATQAAVKGLRFEPAGKRMLKGFDDPALVLTVGRA